jgi:hypothetical protein
VIRPAGRCNISARQLPAGRNTVNPSDVNGSGAVTPEDVLLLINEINHRGSRILPIRTAEQPGPPWFLDPNGDGRLTPADVLEVINHVNCNGASEPEGEADRVFSDWPQQLAGSSSPELTEERLGGTGQVESPWGQGHHSIAAATAWDHSVEDFASAESRFIDPSPDRLADQPLRGTNVAVDPFELESLLDELLDCGR